MSPTIACNALNLHWWSPRLETFVVTFVLDSFTSELDDLGPTKNWWESQRLKGESTNLEDSNKTPLVFPSWSFLSHFFISSSSSFKYDDLKFSNKKRSISASVAAASFDAASFGLLSNAKNGVLGCLQSLRIPLEEDERILEGKWMCEVWFFWFWKDSLQEISEGAWAFLGFGFCLLSWVCVNCEKQMGMGWLL